MNIPSYIINIFIQKRKKEFYKIYEQKYTIFINAFDICECILYPIIFLTIINILIQHKYMYFQRQNVNLYKFFYTFKFYTQLISFIRLNISCTQCIHERLSIFLVLNAFTFRYNIATYFTLCKGCQFLFAKEITKS